MVGIDWLQFKQARQAMRGELQHSAKGTTWKSHKYIKKENGRYYYGTALAVKAKRAVANAKDYDNYLKKEKEDRAAAIENGWQDLPNVKNGKFTPKGSLIPVKLDSSNVNAKVIDYTDGSKTVVYTYTDSKGKEYNLGYKEFEPIDKDGDGNQRWYDTKNKK